MDKDLLLSPKPPWLHMVVGSISDITDFAWSLVSHSPRRIVVRILQGKRMINLDSLFHEFAAVMQFPYYFGENWDAFDECLTDLEWISGDSYVLVLTDSQFILTDESKEQFSVLTDILQNAGEEWSQPVETSEAWARPAKAFHVIFQCTEADSHQMRSRLEHAKAGFQEFRIQNA